MGTHLYRTSTEPLSNLYRTSTEPLPNLYRTSTEPLPNLYRTSTEPNLVQNLTHLRPKEVTSPPPYLKTKTFAMTPEATSWARVALHKFKLENYKNYKSISI